MLLANLHCHTEYSFDSKATIDEMCLAAIDAGLHSVAFTEHWDQLPQGYAVPPAEDSRRIYNTHSAIARQAVMDARERYSGRINVLYAIELGQPNMAPEDSRAFLNAHDFDFVLSSIHNDPSGPDYYFVNYREVDVEKLLEIYYRSHLDMIAFGGFDSIGHLDYPIRVMKDYIADADLSRFRDVVAEVVRAAAKQNLALEINTQGLSRWFNRVSPEPWVLKLYRSFGGEYVTVGSDAHRPDQVGLGIREGYALAEACGLRAAVSYRNHTPIF